MLPSKLEELIEQAAREEWEELDLSGKYLTELPPSIEQLKSIKKLILGKWDKSLRIHIGNHLTSLPVEISKLTNLRDVQQRIMKQPILQTVKDEESVG
jgi:Leucine-rich repeat (LRR) protein